MSELPRILIVDDFVTNLNFMRMTLSRLEAEIVEARSGKEALGQILKQEFAVILLDVNMPEIDGFEVAEIANSIRHTRHMPIIFVSASVNDPAHRKRGYETGAVDFIQKPVEADILISKVKNFIELYRRKRQLELLHGELEERSTELQRTQKLSRIGGWAINLPMDSYSISDHALEIFFPSSRGKALASGRVETFLDLLSVSERTRVLKVFDDASAERLPEIEFDVEVVDEDHCLRIASSIASLIYSGDNLVEIKGAVQDVTERKGAEEQLQHAATHDALTGLPNRYLFKDRLDQAFHTAERAKHAVAVLLIDLDHFKEINDTLGHPAGDALLLEVGARLTGLARSCDTVARLGGDEFAIICTELFEMQNVGVFAQRCIDALSRPFEIEDQLVRSGCSIGISCYPTDGQKADQLIKYADLALYQSKARGRGVYHLYNNDMSSKIELQKEREDRLFGAISGDELELYFQPVIDLKTLEVAGTEALVRWNHPVDGVVCPQEFIPLARKLGLACDLDTWVLRQACKTLSRWGALTGEKVKIAINVSVEQVCSEGFVDRVRQIMAEEETSGHMLEFEITEGAIQGNPGKTCATLDELRLMGITIALDDFGTGHSSLAHLKHSRASTLKLDRLLVGNIMDDQFDLLIVKRVIELAHDLNMKVVAEGVELEEQLESLGKYGCDLAQGYLFTGPLAEREFLLWLGEYNAGISGLSIEKGEEEMAELAVESN
jgi:diguanylate cyclase (GGDEF)-like protein